MPLTGRLLSCQINNIIMRRRVIWLFLLNSIFLIGSAQLKSPEAFLGYKIGNRFTPHHKIVDYFNHVSANAAGMMKLEQYGVTIEGRPLLLVFISSTENIRNLESIRMNNLRLANLAKDKMAPAEENVPAI